MKTKKDGRRVIRFMALILPLFFCMLAMELVVTAYSYADGKSCKLNEPVGQNKRGSIMNGLVKTLKTSLSRIKIFAR